jgi:hypothetical protein
MPRLRADPRFCLDVLAIVLRLLTGSWCRRIHRRRSTDVSLPSMPGGFWKFHELREGLRISLSTWRRRGRSRPAIRLKGRSAKRSFDFAMRRLVRRDFASGQDSLRGREHIVIANPCRD